ncbi:MAG: ECF-type sigma factor [Bacteroidota bacterium]
MPDASTTVLFRAARGGDPDALGALLPRVYDDLRQIAHARLRRQRPGETLNTTAVVHEAYLRLASGDGAEIKDRSHFFALAARAMRFVLVDYARERSAQKRGGDQEALSLTAAGEIASKADADAHNLLTLDAALARLADRSERLAEVVEMRFFGGMEHAEIAEATGRSVPTVKRDWRRARAWLHAAMTETTAIGAPGASSGDPSSAGLPSEE